MTIHNHDNGAVIPSYNDMNTNLDHYTEYGVITAGIRIGVVKYNMELSQKQIDLVLATHSTFVYKIYDDFEKLKKKEIKKCNTDEEYNSLFYSFVSENIDLYVNEFNSRLKDYNVEITYFNIEE